MTTAAAGAIELRPLEDDRHLAPLARLHAAIFDEAESTRLGARYIGAYFDWYRRTAAAVALVAFRDEAIGYVLGSPYGSERERYRALFGAAASAWLARPRLWLRADVGRVALWRLASLARGAKRRPHRELPAPIFLLDQIGVAPSERGRGVGALLLDGFRDVARERGARTLLLWSRTDAVEAQRAYERAGWRRLWSVWPDRFAYSRDCEP